MKTRADRERVKDIAAEASRHPDMTLEPPITVITGSERYFVPVVRASNSANFVLHYEYSAWTS